MMLPNSRGCVLISEIKKCTELPPLLGFPAGSDGKKYDCNVGDRGSISGSGRSPGEGNGNPLQYFCLENPMDRGSWWATVFGLTESWIY